MRMLLAVLTVGVFALDGMEARIQETVKSAGVVRSDAQARHRHFVNNVEELVHSLHKRLLPNRYYRKLRLPERLDYISQHEYEGFSERVDDLLLTIKKNDEKIRLKNDPHFANKIEKLVHLLYKNELSESDYSDTRRDATFEQTMDELRLTIDKQERYRNEDRPFLKWVSDLILNRSFGIMGLKAGLVSGILEGAANVWQRGPCSEFEYFSGFDYGRALSVLVMTSYFLFLLPIKLESVRSMSLSNISYDLLAAINLGAILAFVAPSLYGGISLDILVASFIAYVGYAVLKSVFIESFAGRDGIRMQMVTVVVVGFAMSYFLVKGQNALSIED